MQMKQQVKTHNINYKHKIIENKIV